MDIGIDTVKENTTIKMETNEDKNERMSIKKTKKKPDVFCHFCFEVFETVDHNHEHMQIAHTHNYRWLFF